MKKRLILIISILLITIMSVSVFVACGKPNSDFKKFIKETKAKTELTEIIDLEGAPTISDTVVIDSRNSTRYGVVFKDTTNPEKTGYKLYSVAEKAVKFTTEKTFKYDTSLMLWKTEYLNQGVTRYEYIDCVGSSLNETYSNITVLNSNKTIIADVVLQGGVNTYYIKDNKIVNTVVAGLNKAFIGKINVKTSFGKDYIMQPVIDDGVFTVTLYRTADFSYFKALSIGNLFNESAELISINMLNNGNLLIQVCQYLPEDSKEYQMLYDGQKANLKTYIYDINKDKDPIKEIKSDYIFPSIYNEQTMKEDYNSNYANYAFVYKIVDKNIIMERTLIAFDDNLKIKFVGDSELLRGALNVMQVAQNKYMISFIDKTVIVNGEGAIESTFNQMLLGKYIPNFGFKANGNDNIFTDFAGKVQYVNTNEAETFIGRAGNNFYVSRKVLNEESGTTTVYSVYANNASTDIPNAHITGDGDMLLNGIYSTSDGTTAKIINAATGAEMKSFAVSFTEGALGDSTFYIEDQGKVSIVVKNIA